MLITCFVSCIDHLADPLYPLKAYDACLEFATNVFMNQAPGLHELINKNFWQQLQKQLEIVQGNKYDCND